MTTDRRPTREAALRALRDDPPLDINDRPVAHKTLVQTVDTLDRAGFIKPEPRQAGWYAVRWGADARWVCGWHDGAGWWKSGIPDHPEPHTIGPRIPMPDESGT